MENDNLLPTLGSAFAFGVVVVFILVVLAPFYSIVDGVNGLKARFGWGGA